MSRPKRQHDDEPRLGLSVAQVAGSALAAASAAFGASFLGVAGTIAGAAVASVIATVGSAMYTASLRRSTSVVRRTRATRRTDVAAVAPVPDPSAPARPPRPLPWGRISVAAAAVLVVTLSVLTGVEGLLGRPLASVVGGSDATGTSIGSVDVGRSGDAGTHSPRTPTHAPTPAVPGSQVAPADTPSTPPTDVPTTQPSGSATAPPTALPTSEPTATPSAAEPTPTP
jgi:hypothetical protein